MQREAVKLMEEHINANATLTGVANYARQPGLARLHDDDGYCAPVRSTLMYVWQSSPLVSVCAAFVVCAHACFHVRRGIYSWAHIMVRLARTERFWAA